MEEEISLREIIEILLEGKWIIAGITSLAILISGVVSFFVLAPTYEAEATVMINNIQENDSSFLDGYVNEMVSPTIYAERLKTPVLLERVLETAKIKEEDWTLSGLRKTLNVEVDEETGLISIKLKGKDPEQIALIVNTLIEQSKVYTGERIAEKIDILLEEYETQMQLEQAKLDEAIAQYNELKAGSGLPALVLFQESVGGSQFVIEANKEIIDELKDLDKTKQIELKQINTKINKLTQLYNSYNTKYTEARSISSFALAKNKITPIMEAIVPDEPVAPRKVLNVAIATVIGVMLGVFIAFFRSYWNNTNPHTNSRRSEEGETGSSV